MTHAAHAFADRTVPIGSDTSASVQRLLAEARAVLDANDMGTWTRPTMNGLYPHQWLWDSFFIAIGQRHYDIERAKAEVRSPFRAQWSNGMLPHIIFSGAKGYHAGPELWHCERSKSMPAGMQTSGVTQPPMAAEAVVRVGQKLNALERKEWYAEMYPKLLAYHQWFYRERNPRADGLPVIVLSWETGMDNTPPWMSVMHEYALSLRTRLVKEANLERVMERFRKDTKAVAANERISTIDLYAVYDLVKKLRHHRYDAGRIMRKHSMQVVDVAFSCILIRANECLKHIAEEIGVELPDDIKHAMRVAPHALETLWDDATEHYYNRNEITGELIKIPTISTFMPLYALKLPDRRVEALMRHMHDPASFATAYPLPSTPANSPYFTPNRYWQGPTWVNMNWLIMEGLRRNGRHETAEWLRRSTVDLIARSGMHEYFSPHDGSPAGADNFSWTAALLIDLISG